MSHDGPEALDAVVGPFLPADFAALGVVSIAPLVTGEGDDVGETCLGTGVDRLPRPGDDLLMIARIVEAAHKGHPRHAVGGNGANQVVLFQDAPVLGRDNFHGRTTQVARLPAGPFQVPSLPGSIEAPENHGLPDTAIDHRPGLRSFRFGRQTRQSGRRPDNRQPAQQLTAIEKTLLGMVIIHDFVLARIAREMPRSNYDLPSGVTTFEGTTNHKVHQGHKEKSFFVSLVLFVVYEDSLLRQHQIDHPAAADVRARSAAIAQDGRVAAVTGPTVATAVRPRRRA